jgi:hypothetical protein
MEVAVDKCGSIDPSVDNLDLWIKPTLFLRSGSFATVFPRVTEAWRLAQASLTGAAVLGGAVAPVGLASPSDAANPASWPWSIASVV